MQHECSKPETPRVLSIMPKILEILVGIQMERSVSVSSDRNIWDHLWRWSLILEYSNRNLSFHSNKPVFALIREFGKGIKHGKSHSNWLAQF